MHTRILALTGFLGAVSLAQATLVFNGDFETPLTADASGAPGYLVVATGDSASISGWTSGGRVGDNSVDIVNSVALPSYPANTGVQLIDLAGSPGPGSIYQDLATSAGGSYTLTFAGSSNGGSSTMEVYWDGALLDTIVTPTQGTWTSYSYNVVASGATTQLMFGSLLSNTSNAGPLLDSVGVNVVPEPATGIVLLAAGLSALRRRRQR